MSDKSPPLVYSIAGSDSSGGAGVQADLATFASFGVQGCALITALTTQTASGVHQVLPTPADYFEREFQQMRAELPPGAIKLGMLASGAIVDRLAKLLEDFAGPVICDPVLSASSGGKLLDNPEAYHRLLPQIDLLTPNIDEARQLTGLPIASFADMEAAGQSLLHLGARAALITGGHLDADTRYCYDYFVSQEQSFWLRAERVDTPHNHGTGCTLASAIAAALARGYAMADALVLAKMAVTRGLRLATAVGNQRGQVVHKGWPRGLANLPAILPSRPDQFEPPKFARCDSDQLGLYPVVDSLDWLEKLMAAGVKTLQLRIKDAAYDALDRAVQNAVTLQHRYRTRLFINDYWQLAIKHGAYGVHLGQEDIDRADLHAIARAGVRLGLSNHAWYEIARAHALRPSYIALGPVYETRTKPMRFAALGLDQLGEWVALLGNSYPLVAIGGIDAGRAPGVAATGVGSIAAVRAITRSEDYLEAVNALSASLKPGPRLNPIPDVEEPIA